MMSHRGKEEVPSSQSVIYFSIMDELTQREQIQNRKRDDVTSQHCTNFLLKMCSVAVHDDIEAILMLYIIQDYIGI